jgi:hypothetical protein
MGGWKDTYLSGFCGGLLLLTQIPKFGNRPRPPHGHSRQVPDGQCVVKLAVFHEF